MLDHIDMCGVSTTKAYEALKKSNNECKWRAHQHESEFSEEKNESIRLARTMAATCEIAAVQTSSTHKSYPGTDQPNLGDITRNR